LAVRGGRWSDGWVSRAVGRGYCNGIGYDLAIWAIGHGWRTAANCANARRGNCFGGVGMAVRWGGF
jgi:hypothetical protein